MVPARGQIKDIVPGGTQGVKAISVFLEEKEPFEIDRHIKHSLTAVERYIDTFCRVAYCCREALSRDGKPPAAQVFIESEPLHKRKARPFGPG